MLEAIGHNFRHLFDFTGRDARRTFWLWVLFVVLLNIALSLAISIPVGIEAASAGMTGATDSAAVEAAITERMAGMAETLVWTSIVIGLANIVLLAASFVRRLHDSGRSALWAILAGAVQAVSLVMALGQVGDAEAMIRNAAVADSAQDAFATQGEVAWRGLIGWIPLIILVVFGVMRPEPGPNAHGEPPSRA